jgi:hypothetical protein
MERGIGETLYRVVGLRPEGAVRNVEAVVPTLEDGYVWLRQQHAGEMVEAGI